MSSENGESHTLPNNEQPRKQYLVKIITDNKSSIKIDEVKNKRVNRMEKIKDKECLNNGWPHLKVTKYIKIESWSKEKADSWKLVYPEFTNYFNEIPIGSRVIILTLDSYYKAPDLTIRLLERGLDLTMFQQ